MLGSTLLDRTKATLCCAVAFQSLKTVICPNSLPTAEMRCRACYTQISPADGKLLTTDEVVGCMDVEVTHTFVGEIVCKGCVEGARRDARRRVCTVTN